MGCAGQLLLPIVLSLIVLLLFVPTLAFAAITRGRARAHAHTW